jgi:ATP:cob(I)alamin adenosyltransferase
MPSVYTRRGDKGYTRTGGDKKVSKSSLYPKVLGHIDELNVMIGWVKVACKDRCLKEQLHQVQSNLFEIAGTLAYHKGEEDFLSEREKYYNKIKYMEKDIDSILKKYGPLNRFLYPGNDTFSIRWHMARVVCRRTERNLVGLSRRYDVPSVILAYINRLSDWLFIQAYRAEKEAALI